jgi:F-type H+-transporting ATPase subunit c
MKGGHPMLRKAITWTLLVNCLIIAAPVYAQQVSESSKGKIDYFIAVVVAAAVTMMVASSVAALAQSRAIIKAVECIARQPSASQKITTTMVIGLALIESLAIYVLVIALILFFANPFTQYVVG